MIDKNVPKAASLGALFILIYTIVAATGDAAAKHIAQTYAAPQLFALSGGLVAFFSFVGGTRPNGLAGLRTHCRVAMGIRSVATVVSAVLFFIAFRDLALAEVFLFVGIMPIMAAFLTPLILNESADRSAWLLLIVGFIGVVCLFPEGIASITAAHVTAFIACLSGVVSMVMARFIGRVEDKPMALLFYPHALMFVVMVLAIPFVAKPMPMIDVVIAVVYSLLLFIGRYFLVKSLAMAPAHVVMPVMNFQFLWMVLLGMGIFAETPALNVYVGASIVILSSIKLVLDANVIQPVRIEHRQRILAPRSGRMKWPRSKSSSHSRRNLMRSGFRSQSVPRSVPR